MEEKKDNKKPYSEHFMEMLENDTRITPKPASDNDMMNIIHSWLKKLTKQEDTLKKEGKCPVCKGMGKTPDGLYVCETCKGTGKYVENK